MVSHMKTTLNIDDKVMKKLREESAKRNTTISELVESALRILLEPKNDTKSKIKTLPKYTLGKASVDISNRDMLYNLMEDN